MIITIDTTKKLTEVEVNLLKVLLGTSLSVKNRAETVPQATKEVEPIAEATKEVKTPSESPNEEAVIEEVRKEVAKRGGKTIPHVNLAELKTLAQDCVKAKDRTVVKAVINKYAGKLTDVKESDYGALYTDLTELKG